jgi:cytidine deaminase
MTSGADQPVIPAAQAQARAAALGGSIDDVMTELLPAARALAVAPISGFSVGAVAAGPSGALYLGANLEFAGAALGASVHAEQSAVANAWAHDETGVFALAVTEAPCGHCRQFLNELVTADRLRVVIQGRPATTLRELLPADFGPGALGVSGGLMQPERHGLLIPPDDPLVPVAWAAADSSYAPYSKAYAGVALRLADGSARAGRYAENAAFNPSLPPLQAALAGLAIAAIPFSEIRRAVLVEAPGPSSQRAATEALLAVAAPGTILTYVPTFNPR